MSDIEMAKDEIINKNSNISPDEIRKANDNTKKKDAENFKNIL